MMRLMPQSVCAYRNTRNNIRVTGLSGQTCLALSLLVLGIFADNHYLALALDDFALFAHGFDGRSYFHLFKPPLFASPGYSSARQIIWRHLHGDLVTRKYADEVHTQFSGNVRQNCMTVSDIHLKRGVRQSFYHCALTFNNIVF
jgi:hypothetical protein